jgi:hypothetical protein
MTGEMRDCDMIGAHAVLYLHEGTALIGIDTLVKPLFWR